MADKTIRGKNKKEKKYRHSIKRQMTIIFVVIISLSLLAVWLINSLFLEKFYVMNKRDSLMSVYERIADAVEKNELESEDFNFEMHRYVGRYNVSIVLINSKFELLNVYSNEPPSEILMELKNNLLGQGMFSDLISQTEDYVMVRKNDRKTSLEYIEMWGVFNDGSFFLMRSPVESIRESTAIANRFLLYIGLLSAVVSGFIIYFITKRMTKPLLKLAAISESMADMNFEVKYTGKSNNEIGLLGHNINRLSESLESSIGELKKANLELMRDNEIKTQVDEMRKEFISNVSHELKTPIALIQGYAEGLKEGVNEEDERDYYCDVIVDEASRMNLMVKKLLTLNQLEFGNYEVNPERFDICSVIRNHVTNAEILTRQDGIETTYPEGECYVWADEFMIEEVFNNYFSNARNHCESEGQKRIDVSIEMQENRVKVCVFNTGKPIPEESLEHLWEKFYKVDKARTREYGGSGVGLSIVKAIMDAHAQEYGVENRDDGVVFWFTVDSAEKGV